MKNFLKGFIVGIGKIIPGVSGAMLAISLGIYDKSLEYICNFKNNKKESIIYLTPIVLGIILSIVFFSRIISFSLDNFYLITMLFFVGLIIGGIPSITCKVVKKDYYISIISFSAFFFIAIESIDNIYIIRNNFFDFLIFFGSGLLEAVGTVVPGVSSTALLMIMGTYDLVITSIGNISNFNILIPFGIGFILGIIIIVKVIHYLFKKCEGKVYAFILGIILSSVLLLIIQSFKHSFNLLYLLLGLVMMVVGIIISNILEIENKKKP